MDKRSETTFAPEIQNRRRSLQNLVSMKNGPSISRLFDHVAPRYDRLNRILSLGRDRRWRDVTAALAGAAPGKRAADFCTGTGDLLDALVKKGCRAVGLDFSPGMLSHAASKLGRSGKTHVLVAGDALNSPFESETFDAVTVSFGIRNLSDLEAGIREMVRVTKKEGRVAILEFTRPRGILWKRVYPVLLRIVAPLAGRVIAGRGFAYSYLAESIMDFADEKRVREILARSGCPVTKVQRFFFGSVACFAATKTRAEGTHGI